MKKYITIGLFTLFFAGAAAAEQKIEDAQGTLKQLEKKSPPLGLKLTQKNNLIHKLQK